MNTSIRTLIYAGAAAAFAGAAYFTNVMMQPPELSGFERVGQKFFPKFDDPSEAAKLRVAVYDSLKEESRFFTVEKHGDQWRIPSHHDYPAEAKKQLAETAASVIGVTREAVASRRKADHERLGVIDPLDEKSTAVRGRGERITLYNDKGKTLIDLIIGNEIEGAENQFYVRVPTEKETYRSGIQVELSTKFSDWIEPDLLKLTSSDLVSLEVSKPIIEEKVVQTQLGPRVRDVLVGEERVQLTRDDGFADWEVVGLNQETEELDDDPVRDAVNTLDDLKIVGVRPKPDGINADLKFEFPDEIVGDPVRLRTFAQNRMRELMGKGFGLDYDDEQQPYLFSREGLLTAATDDGVVYHLHFGNRFEGSLEEIEVGASAPDDAAAKKQAEPSAPEPDKADGDKAESDEKDSLSKGQQGGRYVLVRVAFDAKYIGEEPVEPVKPEKPATDGEKKPADDTEKKPADDSKDATNDDRPDSPPDSGDEAGKDEGGKEKSGTGKGEDQESKKSDAEADYEKALKEYEEAKSKYDTEKSDFDDKAKKGREKVEELNDRFKDWYYVISAENFEKLQLSRDNLVKAKEVEAGEDDPVEAPIPPSVESPNDDPVEAPSLPKVESPKPETTNSAPNSKPQQ